MGDMVGVDDLLGVAGGRLCVPEVDATGGGLALHALDVDGVGCGEGLRVPEVEAIGCSVPMSGSW